MSDTSELSSAPSDIDDNVDSTPATTTQELTVQEVRLQTPKHGRRGIKRQAEEGTTPAKRAKRVTKAQVKCQEEATEEAAEEITQTIPRKRRKNQEGQDSSTTHAKAKVRSEKEETEDVKLTTNGTSKETKRQKTKVETKVNIEEQEEHGNDTTGEKKFKRKRKTKGEKEAEAMPLAARTLGHKMFIGAHVSSAGVAIELLLSFNEHSGNAFALFLKSQRKWANPPLQDEHQTSFLTNCKTHQYDQAKHALPHGSYLVNLAHTEPARATQAYGAFIDDLRRCERLGIQLYNFHPGNTVSKPREEAIAHLAGQLNKAHSETKTVVTVLENMAAGGNVLGSTFEDLRDIIALTSDKSRVGVCLDTCHAFAAGYDLRSPAAFKATMQRFDDVVGVRYLRALHLNDSKAPFASHRDLHANIGTGFLGLRAFHNVLNEPRFHGLPMVLETPIEVRDADGNALRDDKGKEREDKGIWAAEIKMLEGLVGMDVESASFVEMETRLARQGESERRRLQEQVERREEERERKRKRKGKEGRGKGKARGKQKDMEETDSEEPSSEG
ncbi:DNA-(apurinic or apyrimidinic site) lyase [Cryomyces antarcticus]|nr:DNA-(apurinic or apyrimidinic site) lyase [Cryomyces antarcticus]